MALSDPTPSKVYLMANVLMPYTFTNLQTTEIVTIGAGMIYTGLQPMQSLSIPANGSFTYTQTEEGESVLAVNLKANRDLLHVFIYGDIYPR